LPSPVQVRQARPEELAVVGDLVVEAYEALGGRTGEEDRAYLEHVRDARGRARSCPVLVAVDPAGRILGSVTYVPGPDNPYAELQEAGEAGFRILGVAPTAQNRGIGQALVEACIARARADGRHGLAISTSPLMHAAQRLYERLGFQRAPGRDWSPVAGLTLLAYVLDLAARDGALATPTDNGAGRGGGI
jgi:GNAT superfamily N-acetyltransferase